MQYFTLLYNLHNRYLPLNFREYWIENIRKPPFVRLRYSSPDLHILTILVFNLKVWYLPGKYNVEFLNFDITDSYFQLQHCTVLTDC